MLSIARYENDFDKSFGHYKVYSIALLWHASEGNIDAPEHVS
jgi:hypothetical protein